MISIREVAELSGVSPATVSRVMNGTARVEEEKKQKVLQVVKETGFIPNQVARALYKKSSKLIGVVSPNIENPFFNEMASAIEAEAYRNGYRMMLCNTDNNTEKEIENIRMLSRMNADGLVLMTNNEEVREEIENCPMPVVVLDRQINTRKKISYIQSDHFEGGKIAAEHLVSCGCSHIVHMRGPQRLSSARQRYKGYAETCKKYGMKEQIIECDYHFQDGVIMAEQMLKQFPKVDGIIACNDMVAISVYKVLKKEGYLIPEEVQIVGFDNIQLSHFVTPELTTVAQPIQQMGFEAVRVMIEGDRQKDKNRIEVFPVELIVRETTRPKDEVSQKKQKKSNQKKVELH